MKKVIYKVLSCILLSAMANAYFSPETEAKVLNIGKSPNHPEREWKVIESEHFLIHYYQPFDGMAYEMAQLAEEAYFKVTGDLDARPADKIPIIITQDQFLNGYAEPIKNRIVLDPVLSRGSIIGARRFLTHELTHIITYEAFNTGLAISKIYGVNNVPVWFMEGVAQYEAEYWYPSYDRMLRLNTLERTLLSPSERDAFTVLGSHEGSAGYNEGYAIVKYLFNTYGHDKLAKILRDIKANNVPLAMAIERVVGKPYLTIEAEWRQNLEETYLRHVNEREKIEEKSEAVIPVKEDEANIRPQVSPDGRIFTYMSSTGRGGYINIRGRLIGLMPIRAKLINQEGDEGERVAGKTVENEIFSERDIEGTPLTGGVLDYAWSTGSDMIAFTRVAGDNFGQPDTVLDFVSMGIEKGKIKSKALYDHDYNLVDASADDRTNLKWVESPTFSPVEREVAFAATLDEETNIYAINLADIEQKQPVVRARRITNTKNYLYKDLAWSPDGRYIAANMYTPGDGGNIVLVETETGKITRLTDNSVIYTNSDPSWSADGKELYFFSDRDWISNIYRYEMESGRLSQLTNSYQGLEFPFTFGNDLYFTSYYAKGTDIRKINLDETNPVFVENLTSEEVGPLAKDIDREKFTQKDYFPWLSPDLIMPITGVDERGDQIGIQASFDDILQRHAVNVALVYGLLSARVSYGLSYVNRMLDPILGVQLSEFPSIAATQDGKDFYFQRVTGFNFIALRPFFNEISQQVSNIGTLEVSFNNLNPIPELTPADAQGVRRGWNNFVALGWSTSQISGGSTADIHPTDGYRVNFRMENANRYLGSQFEYTQFLLDLRKYFPLWFDHVLAFHPVAEMSLGNTTPLLLGGPPVNINIGIQDFTPLRGFNIAQFVGDRLVMMSTEYRFPIFTRINTVFSGLYLDGLYGALFIDAGDSWFTGQRSIKFNASAGGEIRLRVAVGNRSTLGAYLGIARKITEAGENQFYFGFANSF